MSDLLWLLLLSQILAAATFVVVGRMLPSESRGRWSAGWALLALAGFSVALSPRADGFRLGSYAFGSLFPFAMLAGALRYSGRREPLWLAPAALALALVRVWLAKERHTDAAAAFALMVDPSAMMGAAWLVAGASRGRSRLHRAIGPGFVLLAAVEAYDGYLQIGAGSTASAPWLAWVLASVPLATLQILADLRTVQVTTAAAQRALRETASHLRAARIGSFEWRRGSRVTLCSEETRRILGLETGPEISNEQLHTCVPLAHRARAEAFVRAAIATREAVEVELPVVCGGAERVVQARLEPSFESGRLAGITGTLRDVTDARRAEEALRKSEERLRAILSSLVKARVVVLGKDGAIQEIYGDARSASRYGLALQRPEGERALEFVHPDDVERSALTVAEVFRTGESRELLQRLALPTGTFWFDACVSPLRSLSGQVEVVLVVARDVTEQVRAEEQRRKVEARLVQSQRLESLGLLAGGIAHDFNNLLVGILGNAELALRQVAPDDPAFGRLSDMRSASLRAAGLTRQLLAYAGKTVVSPHPFDLAALVAETLPLLRASLPAGAELAVETPRQGPWICADDGQIGQVVLNLVSNAAEALGERGGEIRVRTSVVHADASLLAECLLSARPQPGEFACLEVSDDGAGIAPEDLPLIFDPFFTTKFAGRGLGLAAVLGIVRSHGGTLRVESDLGKGSTFQVLLPVASAAAAETSAFAAARTPVSHAATLLVVDDEPMVRSTAARMLRSQGFHVVEADSAKQALDLFVAGQDEIDGALLDLTMPETDGIQLFDALRELREELPIVMMSGHSPEDALERVAGRSHAACLPKPFGLAALVATVERVLEKSA